MTLIDSALKVHGLTPAAVMEKCCRIRNENGQIVPLRFVNNPERYEQELLYREIRRQQKLGKPVRIMVLKYRKAGFTTFIMGLFYTICRLVPGMAAYSFAHRDEGGMDLIWRIMMTFHQNWPPEDALSVDSENANQIVWSPPHSSLLKAATAGAAASGVGSTPQLVHLSEIGKYRDNQVDTVIQVLNAMPSNNPNTICIWETTADGSVGMFPDAWHKAEKMQAEARAAGRETDGYVPMFFPWQKHPEYTQPKPHSYEFCAEDNDARQSYREMKIEFTDDQWYWRRVKIDLDCNGDPEMFKQEFPAYAEEAFLSSGHTVFNRRSMMLYQSDQREPSILVWPKEEILRTGKRRGLEPRPGSRPGLMVWEPPIVGERYGIGIDPSGGAESGDYASMGVWARSNESLVAAFYEKLDGDQLSGWADLVGRWYNNALLVAEKNFDPSVSRRLFKDYAYPNLFWNENLDKADAEMELRFGWMTGEQNRRAIITEFQGAIREKRVKLYSADLVHEMLAFEYNRRTGKAEASSGCHDDLLMASMIGYYAMLLRVPMPPPGTVKRVGAAPFIAPPKHRRDFYDRFNDDWNKTGKAKSNNLILV